MRHRLIALGVLLVLALAAIATGIGPLANLGGIVLIGVVTALGVLMLFALVLSLRGLLFDRVDPRHRRFN